VCAVEAWRKFGEEVDQARREVDCGRFCYGCHGEVVVGVAIAGSAVMLCYGVHALLE